MWYENFIVFVIFVVVDETISGNVNLVSMNVAIFSFEARSIYPFLPLVSELIVKIWPSRPLHASISSVLQGTVAKMLLPRPVLPRPRPLLPPFPPLPPWPVSFVQPMSNGITWILFLWDLYGSSFCSLCLPWWFVYKLIVCIVQCVGGSTTLSYSSVLHASVDWAPLPNWCVAKTLLLLALLLSICHSTNYEILSVIPRKCKKTLDGTIPFL